MKRIRRIAALLLALLLFAAPACAQEASIPAEQDEATILLYGETHAVQAILDRELALWQACYAQGMRHLFIEAPYYEAEWLNLWLRTGDGSIFAQVYADWEGSASHASSVYFFYQSIAQTCPETVFHGTDVGHQYRTAGARYLNYLEEQGLTDSDAYARTQEVIAQGKHYYETGDDAYRENMMVENFIREYAALNGAPIMGIYGSAHTTLSALNHSGETANMATQLYAVYGDALKTEDLSALARAKDAVRTDVITVNGVAYEASYFGSVDLSAIFPAYRSRAFWRLENAYAAFKDAPTTGNVLPISNFPMDIAAGEVFVIDYTLADGSVRREYHRCDGTTFNGQLTAVEIQLE